MTVEPHHVGRNVRTYPVWVGNLNDTVSEVDFITLFSRYGSLVSCKIMLDKMGKSKFGYANFEREEEAERAALKLNGYILNDSSIRTKGPSFLRQEGHLLENHPKKRFDFLPENYRPLTDCSFFIQGLKCKKGKNCPYRHSEKAIQSPSVCSEWRERKCLKLDCPYKHPGGKETQRTDTVQGSPSKLLRCGGKCGDDLCAALFQSSDHLANHIALSNRMPTCDRCHAIFPSNVEYQRHSQSCWARVSITSTNSSSSSPEVEIISDTESDNSMDVESPGDKSRRAGYSNQPLDDLVSQTGDSAAGKENAKTVRKRRRGRRKAKKNLPGNQLLSPDDNKHANGGSVSQGHFSTALDRDFGASGIDYPNQYSDSDSDEGAVEYTIREMARLLSLNEQDMLEGEEEEEEERGQLVNGEVQKRGIKSPRNSSKEGTKDTPPRNRMEPVGVFWDIENCPVPIDKSAFGVAAKMRKVFIEGKREAEFMCVCDITKERKDVTDDLHKAQVTLVHVNAIAKNAADDKLRQSLRRFAHTYPSPATVVLISGDVNFSMELNDLIHLHSITVVLVHNPHASDALKVFATRLMNYEEFIKDVEPPHNRQDPGLSRIVLVSGLPHGIPHNRISSRLDRISDNCGGKILRVDTKAGTARVLFRTNEWAKKALKRMNGEDVFSHKISTTLEPPSSSHPHHSMDHLVGPNLAKTFPPAPLKQPGSNIDNRTPPLFRQVPLQPNLPFNAAPMQPFRPGVPMDAAWRGHPPGPLLSPPRGGASINRYPPPMYNAGPVPRPALLMHTPRLMFPPPPKTYHPFRAPPCANPKHLIKPSVPRPEGRILIFKIPPQNEPLTDNIYSLQGNTIISAEVMVLWHSFSEMQVLLKLDFIQTSILRNENAIKSLYEKGELQSKSASKFVEACTKSISDFFNCHRIPWDVTTCGWTPDEEENKRTRSNVVELLRQNSTCWTKFSNFKKRYTERYSTAISEMSVHSACRGAVQILDDQNSKDTQIIIFYEFSPLVKIVNDTNLHNKLKENFILFLSMQPEKRIKLLDFVTSYQMAHLGPLPTSASGKMLQEIITTIPNVTLIGSKPSNIYVTLDATKGKTPGVPRAMPLNLSGISASFSHLVKSRGEIGLPLKKFQQEYQTFFHHSFRVSDYLPGEVGVKELIRACQGIKIITFTLPNGKTEERVVLDVPIPQPPKERSLSSGAATVAAGKADLAKISKSIGEIDCDFYCLLQAPGKEYIPLKKFQQEYQTFFHHSFRVSDYLPGDVGVKELIKACQRIRIRSFTLPNGKEEERVFIDTKYIPTSQPQKERTSPPSATSSVVTSKLADSIPKSITEINANFCLLLQAAGRDYIPMKKFQQEYQTFFHHCFRVSDYLPEVNGVKELIKACQGIKITIFTFPNGKTEERVTTENYSKIPQEEKIPPVSITPSEKQRPRSLEGIAKNFCFLLENSVNKRLPFKNIQQDYQTFFHHSFRVSDYLPGDARLKELLFACNGVMIVDVEEDGRLEPYVCLDSKTNVSEKISLASRLAHSSPPSDSVSTSVTPSAPQISPKNIERFKKDIIEVLSAVEGHVIPFTSFHAHYNKVKGTQFSLSNYQAKKLLHLVEAVPDVVELVTENENRLLKLLTDPKKQFENEIEVLVYEQPHHSITLDCFNVCYESKYGRKINLREYSRLHKLLGVSLLITGSGPNLSASLHPIRLLACEMTELLLSFPSPMPINKIVPAYKEKFGRVFSVSNFGHPKLIRALEALDELIYIEGSGATRVVSLRASPDYISLFSSLSLLQSAPTPDSFPTPLFGDEVVALLMTTHNKKMSLVELTKKYNSLCRGNGPKVDNDKMFQAVLKLSNLKVTGMGPTCYIQLLPSSDIPQKKHKTPPISPQGKQEMNQREATGESEDIYQDMPKLISPSCRAKKKLFTDPSGITGDDSTERAMAAPLSDSEYKRLCSETRRLLLCHQEHAMTLIELVDSFSASGDPANPTPESLYEVLMKLNPGNTGEKFVISSFTDDISISLIQLNRVDCLWKLGEDLIHLFVYHPTPDLSIHITQLETLYAECYSRRLGPAIYAAKDLQQVLRSRQLKKVLMMDPTTLMCTPYEPYKQQVIAQLLTELLFTRGTPTIDLCTLPRLYLDHFKVPLCLDGLTDIAELMQWPKISDIIDLVGHKNDAVALQSTTLFIEQLRYLLTQHDGHIALDKLETIYTSVFGTPSNPSYFKKKLPPFSLCIANYASYKWVVWAPARYPYPPQRRLPGATPTVDNSVTFLPDDPLPIDADFTIPDLIDFSNVPQLPNVSYEEDQGDTRMEQVLSNFDSYTEPLDLLYFNSGSDKEGPPPVITDKTEVDSDQASCDASPYDFLKDDPELMAELSKTSNSVDVEGNLPDEDLRVLAEVLALQKLQELNLASGEPGDVPVHSQDVGPLDYLQRGLSPDQVLAELQKLKEKSGGILNPDQMEPFLDYFGELSSRELDRIEALEGKPKSKKGSGGRRKPTMAIRFPVQSQASSTEGNHDTSIPSSVSKDKPSSSSSSDESSGHLVGRGQYIHTFIEEEDPVLGGGGVTFTTPQPLGLPNDTTTGISYDDIFNSGVEFENMSLD